jgi:hypothetical protein
MRTAAKLVEGAEPFASESIDRNTLTTLERQQRRRRLEISEDLHDIERKRNNEGSSNATEAPDMNLLVFVIILTVTCSSVTSYCLYHFILCYSRSC